MLIHRKERALSLPTSSAPTLGTELCAVITVSSAGSGRNEKGVGSISWRGSSGLNKMHSCNIQDRFSISGVLNQWNHIPGNAETRNSSQECSLLLVYYYENAVPFFQVKSFPNLSDNGVTEIGSYLLFSQETL